MRTFYFGILSIVLASLVSCNKSVMPAEDQRKAIEFDVEYTVDVKGVTLTESNMQSNMMGVVAAVSMADGDQPVEFLSEDADLQELMDDVPVKYMDEVWRAAKYENKKWVPNPYYWPVNPLHQVSFFAYAPYDIDNGISASGDWANRRVEVECTPNANPLYQADLCVADPVLDRQGYDPVSFNFNHTLSWVTFAANYDGALPADSYLRIDELSFYNIHGTNTLVIHPEPVNDMTPDADGNTPEPVYFKWNQFGQNADKTARYDMSIGKTTLGEVKIESKVSGGKYDDFVTSAGVLYILPQAINPADQSERTKMDVIFSFVKKDAQNNNTIMAQFQTSQTLPDGLITFEPAKKYRLGFTLNVDTASMVDFQCVEEGKWIIDWKNSGNNHPDTIIK